MIINQELVKRIKDHFDLNIYETKVWLALLSKGIVSAGETAEISGVPRSRTYDVLESLAKRGFAIVKIGKPVKYIAIDPKVVIDKLKTKALNQAQEKVKSLTNLKDAPEYEELQNLHKVSILPIKAESLSGNLKGRSNILSKIREIFNNSEKEVLLSTSIEDFEEKSRVFLPLIKKLNEDKLKVKIALSGDVEKIKKLNFKNNLKAKSINNTGRFYIADKKEIIFMINPENSDEEVGIWLNSPYFANAFNNLFKNSMKTN
ncbi:hypothetical protein CXT76_00035 [Candidatus Parvarchaeota archaeon]|jgi:sugar-specific transcriptional regulator TrmB|nr:MAG: hypothetical protein CXT76_00035 [Candidatus Parvarchaeota archaeon]HIG51891.1 TrmB family transcriptional regulator [Candidatus Pacearchaeota archaeon]